MMTWSCKHVDSLPAGVRALPRSLRAVWAGAASAAKGRGDSTAVARECGDAAVQLVVRGLEDIGLHKDALEEWNGASVGDHPLLERVRSDSAESGAARIHGLDVPEPGSLAGGEFATWLAEVLGQDSEQDTDARPHSDGDRVTPESFMPNGNLWAVTLDGASAGTIGAFRSHLAATLDAKHSLAGRVDQDGRSWRVDRLGLELDEESLRAVDRALQYAKTNPTDHLEDAVARLRADGFDDHITPEGYLRVRARASRDGVQQYSNGFEVWGEYRPPEEVFNDVSLASWDYKPFTNDHPPEFVGIHNWHVYAVGVVGGAKRVAGTDGRSYVEVDIVVADLATLVAIREGKVELSAGYTVRVVRERGVDEHGDAYEFRQVDIFINHLALVERGRAGHLARIVADGFAWQVVGTNPTPTQSSHNDAAEEHSMANNDKTEVQIAEGLTVQMTADQATAWEKHVADLASAAPEEAPRNDAIEAMTAQIKQLQDGMSALTEHRAELDAKVLLLQGENDRLKADAESRDRAEVVATITRACPKLALDKVQGLPTKDGQPSAPTTVDLKAAAVLDLNPAMNAALDAYRPSTLDADAAEHAAYRKFVSTLFDSEISNAGDRRSEDSASQTPRSSSAQVVDLNSLRDVSLGRSSEAS